MSTTPQSIPQTRHRRLATGALALGALALVACGSDSSASGAGADGDGDARATTVEIGVFQIASAPVLDDIVAGFEDAFVESSGLDPDEVEFVERNAQGDSSLVQSIARELADADLDMIAVLGTPAVIAQAEVETGTPVIALAMGDPVSGGVADSLDAPGGNVTGSIDYIDPARLLDEILLVEPDARRFGTVFDPANDNMRVWLEDLRAAIDARDLELVEATITSSADVVTAARSLGGRVDTVLVGPDATVISSVDAVAQFADDEDLGLYGVAIDASTPGVLATLGPNYHEVGRLAGEAAADVHAGADPAEVPFRRPGDLEWSINSETANRLGIEIPAEVADRATMVDPASDADEG